jgi:hypothetical protein
MSVLLWIAGVLLVLVGGIWAIANKANAPMLKVVEESYRAATLQETDEGTLAYRSMQATDAFIAREKNNRNQYLARLLMLLGVLLVLTKSYSVFAS